MIAIISHLLKLRLLFIWRSVQSIGVVRQILLFIIVIVGVNYFAAQWEKNPSPWVMTGLYILTIFQLHLTRKDRLFLTHQINLSVQYFVAEYLILFLPFGVVLGFYGSFLPILISVVSVFIISSLNFSLQSVKHMKTITIPLPDNAFEWKSGIRQKGIFMLILFILGVIFYHYPFVIPVVMFSNLLIVASFYAECESNHWIQMSGQSPFRFILEKFKILFSLFFTIHLPLLGLFFYEFPDYRLILLFLVGWFSFLLFMIILAKYALFRERESLSTLHSFLIVFTAFSPLHILLFPVPVVMFWVLLKRSLKNLKEIIHA